MDLDDIWRLIDPPRDQGDDEELHPDLKGALVSDAHGSRIEHPSHCASYTEGYNFRRNRDYVEWQKKCAVLLEAHEWTDFIAIYEPKFWLTALSSIEHRASAEEWAQAARYTWYLSDVFWNKMGEWRSVLEKLKAGPGCMSEQEKERLQALGDKLTIFRGCRKDTIQGFSWSLDKEVAEYHAYKARSAGIIVQGNVAGSKVIAFLEGAEDEKEIVVFPEDVTEIHQI